MSTCDTLQAPGKDRFVMGCVAPRRGDRWDRLIHRRSRLMNRGTTMIIILKLDRSRRADRSPTRFGVGAGVLAGVLVLAGCGEDSGGSTALSGPDDAPTATSDAPKNDDRF
jgi:hypothetical protein